MIPEAHKSAAFLRTLIRPVQEHAEEAAQHAADTVQSAGGAEWGTSEMLHHVMDGPVLDLGFAEISLEALQFAPLHLGPLTIDLSVTKHVVFMMLAAILTILTMWIAARTARKLDHGEKAPRGILNVMESFYIYLRDDVVLANIGHGGERFVPLVIAFFFFILFANMLGLLPFGATATGNISVTAALALIALVVVEVAGMRELGTKGYMKTIFYIPEGLSPPMAALMLVVMTPVELIGKLAKPFALAVRLFANMTAGHFVLLALLGLIITYGSFTSATGILAIFGSLGLGLFVMFLEIFVALLQAYIFAMLVSVFIGLIRHAH